MGKVFLSYAWSDRDRVADLRRALEDHGVEVWADTGLVAGERFDGQIAQALEQADAVVIALSGNTHGEIVGEEAWRALRHNKAIYPVLLDTGGTENFVWPLVSDRTSIRIDERQDADAAAKLISRQFETLP